MKFFNHKKIYANSSKGFTLLETLIGITILVLAITATFTAVQTGLSSAGESRDQITSFFLAQEAVEFVRNIRDTNSLGAQPWLTRLAQSSSDPCYSTNGRVCTIDSVTNVVTLCPTGTGSCPFLRQDRVVTSPTYGMYGYDPAWTATFFKREIQIQTISGNEAAVTVIMEWSKGNISLGSVKRTFKIRESIFNWQ